MANENDNKDDFMKRLIQESRATSHSNLNGADSYSCPFCCARLKIKGYADHNPLLIDEPDIPHTKGCLFTDALRAYKPDTASDQIADMIRNLEL